MMSRRAGGQVILSKTSSKQSVQISNDVQSPLLSTTASRSLPIGLSMQLNIKTLHTWFSLWHQWQKRILVCRVIEHCPSTHLKSLATALEPVLHLDFASSLTPLMAALHHEGSQTFRIQRNRTKQQSCTANSSDTILPPSISVNQVITTESTSNIGLESRKVVLPNLPPIHDSNSMKGLKTTNSKPSSQVFLPTIPLTHTKHKPSPASSDMKQSLHLESHALPQLPIERKFYSVPDIRSTSDLLQRTKPRAKAMKRHKTLSFHQEHLRHYKHQRKQLELYKSQLDLISKWMIECSPIEVAHLLLEIVRLCDKELLGYLVQCVYQKLQTHYAIDCLSDDLLLKVFSYLDAKSLCKCASVCRQWYYLSLNPALWRSLCNTISKREHLGDIVSAIEEVHKISYRSTSTIALDIVQAPSAKLPVVVDWKQAYRDLTRLMSKIKSLAMKAVLATSEAERQTREEKRVKHLTSAQLRSSMSLREMLDIVRISDRASIASTTREVVLSAPESAAAKRRRLRAEKEKTVKLETQATLYEEETDAKERATKGNNQQSFKLLKEKRMNMCVIHLLDVATDSRPSVPLLPNPEGIESLILAGFLSPKDRPRPGRAEPIPSLKRLAYFGTTVLCVQCDERKIVAGCGDRLIRVYDIRTGRLVSTLQGHKGSVQCLQFDDNKIISGSWDTTCIIWDVVHFTALKTLAGHLDCVSCLQFCEDILVTGSYDQSLKLWEMVSWLCLRTIYPAHTKPITCLSFNGSVIMSGSEDKTVKVWDSASGNCQAILEHPSRLTSLKLCKLLLATACGNGTLHLWNTITNTVQMQCNSDYSVGMAYITDIAIDRGKVFAAGSDCMLYEWDIATGACVRILQGHTQSLTSVWVGNSKLVTAAEDQSICVWNTKQAITQFKDTDGIENYYENVPIRTMILQN